MYNLLSAGQVQDIELLVDVLNRSVEDLYPEGHQAGLILDNQAIREVT